LIKQNEHCEFKVESFEAEEFNEAFDCRKKTRRRPGVQSVGPEEGTTSEREEVEEDINEKTARLEREAYEKGFDQGQKDGLVLGEKRTEKTLKQVKDLLHTLTNLKAQIYRESEQEILKLALAVAQKVVREHAQVDRQMVIRAIRSSLDFLIDKSRLTVRINPIDRKEIQRFLPDFMTEKKIGKFELTEDRSVEMGGCILETGFGQINATIDEQMAAIQNEVEQAFRVRQD
jgi:flagellar assembly protein FliH